MIFPGVLSGFLSAIIVIIGFFYGLRERQLFRNLWALFPVLFLLTWTLLSWLHPSAMESSVPAAAWVPSMFIAIVSSLLLVGLLPDSLKKPSKMVRVIYWISLLVLCLAIIARYFFV